MKSSNEVDQISKSSGAPHGSAGRIGAVKRPDWLQLILILLLAGYVAAALTPSSYAFVLPLIGSAPQGSSLGIPREIRSDEWAVWTPYMQATVRNQYRRYNETSPYHEDLRNMNPLPLMDWGSVHAKTGTKMCSCRF